MKHLELFDVNACFGRGAYEKPEFETASDIIENMDYLGIERSLVWHYEARDVNPTSGNKLLLSEIAALPANLADRLVPAFVITPACYYEKGTLDFLKTQFATGAVRALRIFPNVSRFKVPQLERILLELTPFKPVVFMDCRGFGDEREVAEIAILADKVPSVTFVLTQKMWGGFGAIIDLMWRCSNVCVDTSWVHMRENIELLVREFGAERVIFGTGFKSHYGAAIAGLAFADITPVQRELIAHVNLERLLERDPAGFAVDGNVEDKPLWDKCRRGERLDVPIIDAHAHAGPTTRGWYLPDNDYETQLSKMVARMDQQGVDEIYVSGEHALFGDCVAGNRILEEKATLHTGRIFGYLAFNPLYSEQLTPLFDDFFSRDFFRGFKLLASYWKVPVTEPDYIPVWEYADKHSLPILLHTWDDSYNSPAMLAEIAPKYPNAKFLLGHSGGGTVGRCEAVELANANPNVYLEYCGSFTTDLDWLDTFDAVGFDKVLFGSDADAHNEAWELGRLLSIPVPDESLFAVLNENFRRILSQ